MQKDFEKQNLKVADENNKVSYINLVELNHINEKTKKNGNSKAKYYFICFIFGILLFVFILFLLFDKNSFLINKLAKNERIRKFFLSKGSQQNNSTSNLIDSSTTTEIIDQTKQDINKIKEDLDKTKEESKQTKDDINRIKEDFNKEKENSKLTKEDLDRLKYDLNKAKDEAYKAKEDANNAKEDLNKIKEDLNKAKEELNQIKEDLNKGNFNKDKEEYKNREDFYKRREDYNGREYDNRREDYNRREYDNRREDINRTEEDKRKEDDKNKEEFDKIREDDNRRINDNRKEDNNINDGNTRNDDYRREDDKNKENFDKYKEEFKGKENFVKNKEGNQGKFYTPEIYGNKKFEISFDYKEAIKAQLDKKLYYSKINYFPKNKLKFAVCTIGKLENLYARDFVLYYLELGVDKIYIYDNNDINGEKFEDVLQDLIDQKFVKIIDMRGKQDENLRKIAYESCYNDYYDIYNWFLFFDFDEYLYIEENTLNNFVKSPLYEKCSSILLYWRIYTDNDQKNYSIESPIKRFTEPISKNQQKLSYFCDKKPMIKGGIKEVSYDELNRIPIFKDKKYPSEYLICNTEGRDYEKNKNDKDKIVTFENAFIKHYLWRSTEEYCLKLGIRKFFKYLKYEKKDYDFFIDQYLMINGGNSRYDIKEKLKKCVE